MLVQYSSSSTSCGSVGGLTGIACGPLLVPVASPHWPNSGSTSSSVLSSIRVLLGSFVFTLRGLENEEEWEGSTLVDFAEIGSFQSRKRASPPARVKKCMPGATWIPTELAILLHSSEKCPPDGYCASSLRPHELSQLQDADLSRFTGQTRRYVVLARLLPRSLDAVHTRPLAG